MAEPPISSTLSTGGTDLGAELKELLYADHLLPGDDLSYQLCKSIYLFHVLGAKMAESPIRLAQSQQREISVEVGPKELLVKAFEEEWEELEFDRLALNVRTQARVYGISSIAMGIWDVEPSTPVDLKKLYKQKLFFNILDPLNTSGLFVDQDPNSPTFQRHGDVTVQGQRYHRSRTCTVLNEEPIYIAWTTSAFGYVGRSVYQRAFFALKSFLQTMITDDAVARKAAVFVAKMEQPGSIVDRLSQAMFGVKRSLLKRSRGIDGNVLSIGTNEDIETLNMRNTSQAMTTARDNIIKNCATAADMPAKLLTQEAFVEGFGEGTEDAKAVAAYIDRVRVEMRTEYKWLDTICMHRAWNPEFYETVQAQFPEPRAQGGYGDVEYDEAFYEWRNSFSATWPSLIREPPSDLVQVDDVKLKAAIATVQVLAPIVQDPVNREQLLTWFTDSVNMSEMLFQGAKLQLDFEALNDWEEEQQAKMEEQQEMGLGEEERSAKPPPPFSGRDSVASVADLTKLLGRRRVRG